MKELLCLGFCLVGILLISIQTIIDRVEQEKPDIVQITEQDQVYSLPPYNIKPTEVRKINNSTVLIKMNGTEEQGVFVLDLPAGEEVKVSHIEGLILSTPKKMFGKIERAPISGVSYNRDHGPGASGAYRYGYLPRKAGAVLVILGKIGSGEEDVFSFSPGQNEIMIKNNSSQTRPLYLYYHDILGWHKDNGWDGERSIFKIELV